MSFAGKVALVTGGASGIGRATVQLLLERGAQVLVADLDEVDGIPSVCCDVSDCAQVEAAVAAAVNRFGGLDIMINNAGLPAVGPLLQTDTDTFARVLAVNVLGVFHGIKHAAPRIAERGGGAIVSTSSKAAVTNLTQTAALELRPFNVRVNCVLPGMISTPMLEEIRSAFETLAPMPIEQMIELKQGRGGDPADIARALVYLASGDAEFVSGAALTADNAMSASLF